MRNQFYRFVITMGAAAATNLLCNWHVLALQERNPYAACSIDAIFPWISLIGFLWLVDDKDARNRIVITAGSSVGLVIGTVLVFMFM